MFHIAQIFQKSFFEDRALPNLQGRILNLSKNGISAEHKRLLFSTCRHAWLLAKYLDMVFPKWSKKKKTASLGLSFLFLGLEEKIFSEKSIYHTFNWVHKGLSASKTDWLKPIARALLEKCPENAELFYKKIEKNILNDQYLAILLKECPDISWHSFFDHPALWIHLVDNDVLEEISKESIIEMQGTSLLIKQNTDQIRNFFEDGKISYQNIASQKTYSALDSIDKYLDDADGLTIIETCAAPGGKSLLLLEWLQKNHYKKNNRLTLCDKSHEKTDALKKNIERVFPESHNSIYYVEHDWEQTRLDITADLIWVDAPCSGSGVIRKHPDVLWKNPIENRSKLHNIQVSILKNALSCLKKNGVLLYTTCSLDKIENDDVITAVLKENENIVCIDDSIIENLGKKTDQGYLMQPSKTQDGLYIAILKRKD